MRTNIHRGSLGDTAVKVLGAVATLDPPITIRAIGAVVGINASTTQRHLNRLISLGLVSRISHPNLGKKASNATIQPNFAVVKVRGLNQSTNNQGATT